MVKRCVLFLVSTADEKRYLRESLEGLQGVLPYSYHVLTHNRGKANAAAEAGAELSNRNFDLVVSAGYARSMQVNALRGALITPKTIIDLELSQRASIFSDEKIDYQFDCLTKENPDAPVMVSSDRWIRSSEDDYEAVFAAVGHDAIKNAAIDCESAAIAQVADDYGIPFTAAKILAGGFSLSQDNDATAFATASDFLRNFDPIVHYVSDVLKLI